MQLLKNLALVIFFSNEILTAFAQDKKQPATDVHSLFSDLPIADASKNSILNDNENAEEKIRKNIFVKATVSKTSAYLGEPILVTYRLFTALKSKSQISSRPSLSNFSAVEMQVNNEIMHHEQIADKDYRVFTIWQAQLNPFQQGDLTIDPMLVDNTVDYIADNNTSYHYSGAVKSNNLTLKIIPLPDKGKPAGFSGVIGKFNISATLAQTTIKAGEKNNLHIEIAGSGNFDNISLPVIAWPAGFDHFIDKEAVSTGKNEFPPSGKKTFDIPFVSNQKGNFTFPSISFSYFNPSQKNYQTVSSNALLINVLPGSADKKEIKPVLVVVPNEKESNTIYLWTLFGSLVLCVAVGVYVWKRNSKKRIEQEIIVPEPIENIPVEIKQTDFKTELANLDMIQDDAQYIEQVKSLLTKMLQEKFNTDHVSEEELLNILYQQTNDDKLVHTTREVYALCGRLLYSPGSIAGSRNSISDPVREIIDGIETYTKVNEDDKTQIESAGSQT